MKVIPATLDDVWLVLCNAHRWHKEEIAAAGMTQRQFLDKAYEWLKLNGGEVLYLDDKLACVVGYDGKFTWFLATEAYYNGGMKVLRHAQRYWRGVAAKRDVWALIANRPELLRWLKLLGFKVVEDYGETVVVRLLSTAVENQASLAA